MKFLIWTMHSVFWQAEAGVDYIDSEDIFDVLNYWHTASYAVE
jgi:hypothetical protein